MFNARPRRNLKRADSRVVLAQATQRAALDVDQLPDDAFLFIRPGGEKDSEGKTAPRMLRMLPFKNNGGEVDQSLLRAAVDSVKLQSSIVPQDQEKIVARATQLLQTTNTHAGAILGAVSCSIVPTAKGGVPDWVQLMPAVDANGEIVARDGRTWTLPDPEALVASFNAEHHDIPFDLEHASEIKAPQGEPAPAVGWVKQLQTRNGEVWGHIEWTAKGADILLSREYRYLSPAFMAPGGKITKIVSVGLTNKPAMVMPALAREENQMKDVHPKIAAALDLDAEKCSLDDALQKIEGLKKTNKEGANGVTSATPSQSQGGDGMSAARIKELETELASIKSKQPSLESFVPRADFDAVKTQLAGVQTERATEKKAAHDRTALAAVEQACKDGKITPATKDFYVQTCSTEAGLAAFLTFVGNAPVVAPDNVVGEGKAPSAKVDGLEGLSAEQLASAKKAGVSIEMLKVGAKYAAEHPEFY